MLTRRQSGRERSAGAPHYQWGKGKEELARTSGSYVLHEYMCSVKPITSHAAFLVARRVLLSPEFCESGNAVERVGCAVCNPLVLAPLRPSRGSGPGSLRDRK